MNEGSFVKSPFAPSRVELYFIVNPTAGGGRAAKIWDEIKGVLDEKKVAYCFGVSRHEKELAQLAKDAVSASAAMIAGVGGDGTLSAIAGSLAGTEVVLGVIPAGTGNDFARMLGISSEPAAACNVLLAGKSVRVDTGRINKRIFINVAGAGLDAQVVADANRIFKKFSGKLGYLLALLRQLLFFSPASLEIVVDGEKHAAKAWLVAVANGRFYGGGMQVAPCAEADDGKADVILVKKIPRLQFFRLFPLVYRGGHISHPAVCSLRGKNVEISADKDLFVHADGEIIGETPMIIQMEKQNLWVRVPGSGE